MLLLAACSATGLVLATCSATGLVLAACSATGLGAVFAPPVGKRRIPAGLGTRRPVA
ncbi:hypothetical protein [Erwinia sp. MYb535]|uniref:hypothetical protein n=1 Tax=Erwinia sp. MYb535 TaxID=2745309 RepID=UPI00309B2B4F